MPTRFQVAITTAYIFACVGLIMLLRYIGLSDDVIGTVTVLLTGAGLWITAIVVGLMSWATLTALAWLALAVAVIFTFG